MHDRPKGHRRRDAMRLLMGLAVTVLSSLALPAPSLAQAGFEVHLARGTAREVRLPAGQAATVHAPVELGDIRIADPAVAEVAPLDVDSLYLLGVGAGRTTVTLYDAEKSPIGVVQVEVGVDVVDMRRTIAEIVPEADVSVTTVNGRLRLGGTVPNGQALAGVLDLAKQYDPSEKFINAIRVLETQQVLLEVRFVEASRRAGRELGVNVAVREEGVAARGVLTGDIGFASDGDNFTAGIGFPNAGSGEGAFSFPFSGSNAFGTAIATILSSGINVDVIIRALEEKGLGRSLAEPNLTALSGEEASFLAGGELPIPIRGEDGDITIEYKEFGVRLTFTPLVLDDGLINLKLEPEVSQVDRSVSVNGTPGFVTRRTQTTVELRDGQSFAISGLLQVVNEREQQSVPYLGQVPVLGALFRSSAYAKRETDLVVIITPRLVRPAKPGEVLPTPLDGSRSASDTEFFLLGLMEVDDAVLKRIREGAGVAGPHGHVLDLPGAHPPASEPVVLTRHLPTIQPRVTK